MFYVATTSLIGWYTKTPVGYLNIYPLLEKFLGSSSAFLLLLVLFFSSVYLALRISYRNILSRVRESVPSFSSVREAVLPQDDEDEMPTKKTKLDAAYKKKAEELERKLENLQKSKRDESEKSETK